MNNRVVVSNRPVRYLQSFVTSKVCICMHVSTWFMSTTKFPLWYERVQLSNYCVPSLCSWVELQHVNHARASFCSANMSCSHTNWEWRFVAFCHFILWWRQRLLSHLTANVYLRHTMPATLNIELRSRKLASHFKVNQITRK